MTRRGVPMLLVLLVGVSGLLASSSQSQAPSAPRIEALAPVEVVAAGLGQPMGVAVDLTGAVLVADRDRGVVYAIDEDGVHARLTGLDRPVGLALDPAGRLLVVEEKRGRLLALEGSSLVVLAQGMRRPRWVAAADDGAIYISARGQRADQHHEDDGEDDEDNGDREEDVILRLSPGGGLTVWADGFKGLEGLLVHADTVLAAARGHVVQIPIQADTLAGPLSSLSPSSIDKPVALAVDRLGALYVSAARLGLPAMLGESVGKISPDGILTRFAWRLEKPQGMAVDGSGHLYVADGTGRSGRLLRFRAPPAPDVDAPAATNQSPVTVAGHAEPGARVDVSLNGAGVAAVVTPHGDFMVSLSLIPNAENTLTVSATAHDGRGLTGASVELTIVHDGIVPLITGMQPADGALRNTRQPAMNAGFSDAGAGIDPASAIIELDGVSLAAEAQINASGFAVVPQPLAEGEHTLFVQVADRAGNTASASAAFVVDVTAPAVTGLNPADGATVSGTRPPISGGFSDAQPGVAIVAGVDASSVRIVLDGTDRTGDASVTQSGFSLDPGNLAAGAHALAVTLADLAGNSITSAASFTIAISPGGSLPPDPATVAPRLHRSVTTTIGSATEFLYTGSDPIQTGVAPGTIEPKRAAVLRGRVSGRDGTPLPGVTVRVHNHPELGRTLSRADGMFDLAINGGGLITVSYEAPGFLPAQRQVETWWQEYFWLPEVALVALDSRATTVDLTSSAPVQVARGSVVTDADGPRQATLLFFQGTTARAGFSRSGSNTPLSTLTVRATEYTIGPRGPAAMPATLPPSSAYTYAVELSVDEAMAAGAPHVLFNRPVMFYVENFLRFPVGLVVPSGYYDRQAAAWRASDNGRIIAIVGVTAGLAEVDSNGDGVAEDATALAALAMTDVERQQLAVLYQPGQSLWRVPVTHFSPIDHNFPFGPPLDADNPNRPAPQGGVPEDESCSEAGSIIECQNQTLGERVGVTGTPFTLNYRSDRVPGRRVTNSLEISLTGASMPPSLARIELEVLVAGRRVHQIFPAEPNLRHTFVWDGQDAYGRALQGVQPVTIRLGHVYSFVIYETPAESAFSFARLSGAAPIVGGLDVRPFGEFTFWQQFRSKVGTFDSRALGLGAWSLDVHHAYDPVGQGLYSGDGSRRTAQHALSQVIESLGAGGAQGLAVTRDGTVYGARTLNHQIASVTPNNAVTIVAGSGVAGCNGPSPATQHRLRNPTGLAAGPADIIQVTSLDDFGNPVVREVSHPVLYIADSGCHQVHHLRAAGGFLFIETIVGDGIAGYDLGIPGLGGDGVPAHSVRLSNPTGLAVARDGSLYIADTGNSRIRRIEPGDNGFLLNSIITTVVGTPVPGFSGDGGAAMNAQLNAPTYLAVGDDGSLYIADTGNHRVRRVSPSGVITTLAGTGVRGFSGDGGPATDAQLDTPRGLAWAPDGLYIVDAGNRRVRRLTPDGVIATVAGGGFGVGTDGGPLAQATFLNPSALAFGPDRSLLIADAAGIRVVRPALPGFTGADISLPSDDGMQLFHFDGTGRHLDTRHALTGGTLYTFGYDAAGRLTTVTDGDGNVTTVERDGMGNPTAIVAPFGQRTTLTVDGNGYLATVTNPAGEQRGFVYHDAGGLLATHTDPRGGVHRFNHDARGYLVSDENPDQFATTLERSDTATGFQVTRTTSPGRQTGYLVENLPDGEQRRVTTFPAGVATELRIRTDGSRESLLADGMRISEVEGPDPRFGMSVPVMAAQTLTTPGGLTSTLTSTRAVTATGLLTTITINGRTHTARFDAASRTITHTTPAGRRVLTVLDEQGRPVREELVGLAPITHTYDARGRLATLTAGTGAEADTLTIGYDAGGYPATLVDSLGQTVTTFERDPAGRITRERLADGEDVLYGYDGNGNVVAVTPPGRPAHTLGYTAGDLLAASTPPDVGVGSTRTEYAYGADGQLRRMTRPDGQTAEIEYDAAGRPITVAFLAGQLTYAYDASSGRLTSVTAPGGVTLTSTHDGFLPTSDTLSGPVRGTVARTYDEDFRLASENVNEQSDVGFAYDLDGLTVQAGALSVRRHPQHGLITGTTLGVVDDEWTYDAFGAPQRYRVFANGVDLFTAEYTRDRFGRIMQKTEVTGGGAPEVHQYTYDTRDRLAEVRRNGVVAVTYAYDANGNRLSATRPTGVLASSHDAQDRLRQHGAATYTYTAAGDLLMKTVGSQTTHYDYDTFGNLRRVTPAAGGAIDYVIDGRSRRVGKRVNGVLVQGFLYRDDLSVAATLDGAGVLVSRFVYGSRRHTPDYMERGGQTYRIVSDHLGSPRLVVNDATGAVAQQLDYDELGNVVLDTNPGFQPFGFAGGLYDADTKLVRFGARDYDAESGRWTTKDPRGFDDGTNLYAYAANDPVNRIDPTGTIGIIAYLALQGVRIGADFPLAAVLEIANLPTSERAQALQELLGSDRLTPKQLSKARAVIKAARELAAMGNRCVSAVWIVTAPVQAALKQLQCQAAGMDYNPAHGMCVPTGPA